MPSLNVYVNEKFSDRINEVATVCGGSSEDLLTEFVDDKIEEYFVEFIIKKYKEGKLTARIAWKASGLNYQEFQNKAAQ